MNDKIEFVIECLIAICGILLIILIFAEPSFTQKESTNITIEYKWKQGGIYDSYYFSDSNENTYVLYGKGKGLRHEKLKLNCNYSIEVTSHYFYLVLASHSEEVREK